MFFSKNRRKKIGKTLFEPSFQKKAKTRRLRFGAKKEYSISKTNYHAHKFFSYCKKIILLSLIFSITFGSIYLTMYTNFLNVRNLYYELDNSDLKEADFNPYLKGILGTNILKIKPDLFEDRLKNIFPQLEQVQVIKVFPHSIKIITKTYPISANIINKYQGVEKKFLINEGGYLVSKDLENPNYPYIIVAAEKEFQLKNQLMTSENLKKILSAIKIYEDFFNMKVFDAIYLKREREIHLRTEKYFLVLIDLQQDVEKQLKKLKTVLPKLNIYQENLEYIDLRIPGNNAEPIFFKRR